MDFTQGNITKKLLKFMIPILGSLILQAMYGAVDLLIVGRFGSQAGISAVSTGGNVPSSVFTDNPQYVAKAWEYLFSLSANGNLFKIGIAIPMASVYGIIFFSVCYVIYVRRNRVL